MRLWLAMIFGSTVAVMARDFVYGNVDLYIGDDKQIWAGGYENG